jgi:hypothetical protein
LTTSTAGKALPMLQILAPLPGLFKFASVAMDFMRLRLDESRVIEMMEPSDTHIISCIEKWLSESHSAARRQFHEELVLTSGDAETAYWLIREYDGKIAAKSAMLRFVRANGFATISWRVLCLLYEDGSHIPLRLKIALLRQNCSAKTICLVVCSMCGFSFARFKQILAFGVTLKGLIFRQRREHRL